MCVGRHWAFSLSMCCSLHVQWAWNSGTKERPLLTEGELLPVDGREGLYSLELPLVDVFSTFCYSIYKTWMICWYIFLLLTKSECLLAFIVDFFVERFEEPKCSSNNQSKNAVFRQMNIHGYFSVLRNFNLAHCLFKWNHCWFISFFPPTDHIITFSVVKNALRLI